MWEHQLTQKELELVDVLKGKELTRNQATALGYTISDIFLLKCHFHGILIYESVDKDSNKIYGVMK